LASRKHERPQRNRRRVGSQRRAQPTMLTSLPRFHPPTREPCARHGGDRSAGRWLRWISCRCGFHCRRRRQIGVGRRTCRRAPVDRRPQKPPFSRRATQESVDAYGFAIVAVRIVGGVGGATHDEIVRRNVADLPRSDYSIRRVISERVLSRAPIRPVGQPGWRRLSNRFVRPDDDRYLAESCRTTFASSSRSVTSSLVQARYKWPSTVRTESVSRLAISRFDSPSATSATISRSRDVTGSGRAADRTHRYRSVAVVQTRSAAPVRDRSAARGQPRPAARPSLLEALGLGVQCWDR
jgi:hypothetical protein